MDVIQELRQYLTKPHVRPWALAAPILVLLFCLPLLRPLRHPDPSQISDDELGRLATVQSLVEHNSLSIDHSIFAPAHNTVRIGDKLYAEQSPTLSLLLAGPYWLMHRFGFSFSHNANFVEFFLTLLGVTLPVAIAAGLIYRMGRLFELPRWKRSALAIIVAFASGLVSYAVVLNAHAPAAALIIASAACLAHVASSRRPAVTGGWLAVCGLCAGLAATIEPAAAIFTVLLIAVIPAMRWRPSLRAAGVLMYLLGLTPPLLLHAVLTVPITGDMRPINFHNEFYSRVDAKVTPAPDDDDDTSKFAFMTDGLARLSQGTIGEHGVLSHFPILLLGILGISAVMHRHWPTTTKILAGATALAAAAIVIAYSLATRLGAGSMFAAQYFVIFIPLLVFWSGAWLRRSHHPVTWTLAGLLLIFSTTVSLIGATNPFPREGYNNYSVTQALNDLVNPTSTPNPTILAGSAGG
jgi:hypothetical protein